MGGSRGSGEWDRGQSCGSCDMCAFRSALHALFTLHNITLIKSQCLSILFDTTASDPSLLSLMIYVSQPSSLQQSSALLTVYLCARNTHHTYDVRTVSPADFAFLTVEELRPVRLDDQSGELPLRQPPFEESSMHPSAWKTCRGAALPSCPS